MTQYNALINKAYKEIDNATTLLETSETPFNAMYRQYRKIQSLWFKIVEEASASNNSRLEDVCIDLEEAMNNCKDWIDKNSPSNQQADQQKDKEE